MSLIYTWENLNTPIGCTHTAGDNSFCKECYLIIFLKGKPGVKYRNQIEKICKLEICTKQFISNGKKLYCEKHFIFTLGMGGRDKRREFVRIRDDWTCQICYKIWEKGKRRFDVHHTDPYKESMRTPDADANLDEMITLCHKCHMNLPHIKIKMRRTYA